MSAASVANRSESGANSCSPHAIAASGAPHSCPAGGFCGPRRIDSRFAGSLRMPSSSNCSSIRKAGLHPVAAVRREPAQMLADRVPQLPPAQPRIQRYRRLDVGNLAAPQPLAEKRRRLQVLDPRIQSQPSRIKPIRAYDARNRAATQAAAAPSPQNGNSSNNSKPYGNAGQVQKFPLKSQCHCCRTGL